MGGLQSILDCFVSARDTAYSGIQTEDYKQRPPQGPSVTAD